MKTQLALFFLFFLTGLSAQHLDYRQGDIIVQFAAHVDGKAWSDRQAEIDGWQRLAGGVNIYLVRVDHRRYAEDELVLRYRRDPAVVNAQLNNRLGYRRRPNDPRYPQQWQFRNVGQIGGAPGNDYRTERAWDVTTGGLSPGGDSIAVAVIDNGIDLDHEDIAPNLWINHDEIAGNGIDDDNNGYVDDRFGWNTDLNNGNVEAMAGEHGTPVSGQIGARGNNGLGVTGINWRVKLLHINNDFDFLESEVIQAYGYALDARREYDASGGNRGAYVVTTNASWGRDFSLPEDSPIWCALYDTLGTYGILSVAATDNRNIDVEVRGDLPSRCTSDFLLTVTNLNTFDEKVENAAFGVRSIDLGAYGEEIVTTMVGNSYGTRSGTSFAAPAVTGTVALLYAAPCENFGQLQRSDPAAAARYVKDVILRSARPVAELEGLTVSGGRLDVGAAMDLLMNECGSCLQPTSIEVVRPANSATSLVLSWRQIDNVSSVDLRYRPTGSDDWVTVSDVGSPYTLDGLTSCTDYELQFLSRCGGEEVASKILRAETRGCCRIPEDLRFDFDEADRLVVSFTPLLAARSYRIRYRAEGITWTESGITASGDRISGLDACETYELEFSTDCDTLVTEFGGLTTVLTPGCGVCLDADYCEPSNLNNAREWIAEVSIPGIFTNASGKAPGGYVSYGELAERAVVPGGVYPIALLPGFSGNPISESFIAWADWDQNGFFTSNEVIANTSSSPGGPARQSFTVPEDADLGLTRLRVVMEFPRVRGVACPSSPKDGEAEDYCIEVAAASGCPPPSALTADYDNSSGATTLRWGGSAAAGADYLLRYRPRNSDEEYVTRTVNGNELTVENLNLCGAYDVQLASICGGTAGAFRSFGFGDDCTGNRDRELKIVDWSIVPNPAVGETRIGWNSSLQVTYITIYGVDGKRLREVRVGARSEVTLNVSDLPSGVYLVRLVTADGKSGLRRLVVR